VLSLLPLFSVGYRRMMSNRASAKRSRQRRQERLDELEIVSAKLQVENSAVQRRLVEANERIRKFQHENESLQSELRMLKSMVEAKGMGGAHQIHKLLPPGGGRGEAGDEPGQLRAARQHNGAPVVRAAVVRAGGVRPVPRAAEAEAGGRGGEPHEEPEDGRRAQRFAFPLPALPPAPAAAAEPCHPVSNMTSTSTNGDDSPLGCPRCPGCCG